MDKMVLSGHVSSWHDHAKGFKETQALTTLVLSKRCSACLGLWALSKTKSRNKKVVTALSWLRQRFFTKHGKQTRCKPGCLEQHFHQGEPLKPYHLLYGRVVSRQTVINKRWDFTFFFWALGLLWCLGTFHTHAGFCIFLLTPGAALVPRSVWQSCWILHVSPDLWKHLEPSSISHSCWNLYTSLVWNLKGFRADSGIYILLLISGSSLEPRGASHSFRGYTPFSCSLELLWYLGAFLRSNLELRDVSHTYTPLLISASSLELRSISHSF